ncbi:homologous-pairing protein 2 homolog [Chrysoperla carnea]|uniref:homologous-pairing protein 2 homolog n=1 Tax=Chrysoperla carnea TaxID=189513 RepID=UPI001D06D32D|nr:homologous-pairing protein 2 homolog [Chrysoperla carnea]
MATNTVLKYLEAQNRPYSANDLVTNLKDLGKAAVQKALDQLVETKKIIEKTYGKQKVYSILQENTDQSIDQMNEEIRELDAQTQKVTNELKTLNDDIKSKDAELKTLQSSLKTQDAIIKRDELKEKIEKLQSKLTTLQETQVAISNEEKKQIINDHTKFVKEYRKRKRICMDIIDSIMESYPKSKKQLMEEIGIETDEDANFKLTI